METVWNIIRLIIILAMFGFLAYYTFVVVVHLIKDLARWIVDCDKNKDKKGRNG